MHTLYQRASYLRSAHTLAQLPADEGSEVAFAGRSNAGKSSALNALVGQRNLARTSKTPGRTQQIVFFQLDKERRLVDLPGYGYAKVPRGVQQHWEHTLTGYLRHRSSLKGLVLLMDVRHPLMPQDEQLLMWCTHMSMPVHILLTKADKLSRSQGLATLHSVQRALQPQCALITLQLFSALKNQGLAELRARLDAWLGILRPGAEHVFLPATSSSSTIP